jgi:hypothetical protein
LAEDSNLIVIDSRKETAGFPERGGKKSFPWWFGSGYLPSDNTTASVTLRAQRCLAAQFGGRLLDPGVIQQQRKDIEAFLFGG